MSQIHKISPTNINSTQQTKQAYSTHTETKSSNTKIANQNQRSEQTRQSNAHQHIMDAHAVQRRSSENQDHIKHFKKLHARQLNQRRLSLDHQEQVAQTKLSDKKAGVPKPSMQDLEEVSALLNGQHKDKKNLARMVRQFQHKRLQRNNTDNPNYQSDITDDDEDKRISTDRTRIKSTQRTQSSDDVLSDLRQLGSKEDPANVFMVASAIQQDKNTSPEDKKRIDAFLDKHYAAHKERIHADFNIADVAHTAGANKDGSRDVKKITQFTEKYYVMMNMAMDVKDTANLLFHGGMSVNEYKKETNLFGMAAKADIDGRRLLTSNQEGAHAVLSFAHRRTAVLSGFDTMLSGLVKGYSKMAQSLK
jgi:HrpJ-like domain